MRVFNKLERKIKDSKKAVKNYTVWRVGKKYEIFDVENPPELVGVCGFNGKFVNINKTFES